MHVFETPIEEARRLGAMMLFGEKYGDIVRVVEVPGYSAELCGGTHVRTTAEIGALAILSESSIGSGARRIEAVTSGDAWAYLRERSREADELRKELDAARKRGASSSAASDEDVAADVRVESGVNVIVQSVDGLDSDGLLDLSDRFKQRHAPAAVVLGSRENGTVHLVANFDATVAERVSASDVVRQAAAIVGGGGGGRATMARAGGKDAEKLPEALAEAARLIVAALCALDYGSARTGVAVSDATGTIAVPLEVVEQAATPAGVRRIGEIVREREAERVVVGLPLTLRGEHGDQARETDEFISVLRAALDVPVETYDERFTTALAARESGDAAEDARAAAHLLENYLERTAER